jgi:DNA-directed RNA polymerase subunit K/omega
MQGHPVDTMSLEELLLDCAEEKYYLVNYAIRWAKELSKKENAPKAPQDLMNAALRDIITGKVSVKELKKLIASKMDDTKTPASDKNGKKEKK